MEGKEMQKTMGAAVALSMVVGCVIGSGVFFKPQAIYTATGGAPGIGIISWVIGGLITLCAGLTVAEIAVVIPKTGGMMVYLEEVFGEKVGYLAGWMQSVLFFPGTAAALAVAFGNQLSELLGHPGWAVGIAIVDIIVVAIINNVGSKAAGLVQNLATVGKVIPLVLIAIFAFVKGSGTNPILTPMVGEGLSTGTVLGSVLISILFAYEGWINVTPIVGEMKDPGKDLPKAFAGGILIIMAIYLLVNVAYLWVLPADQLAQFSSPAVAVAEVIFGSIGGKIIALGILISVFGALNGFLLAGSRVVYTLGVQGTIPGYKFFGKLNKSDVPGNGVILVAFLACIYALTGQFNLLTDLATFTGWLFYVMTFIAVIILRKTKPDVERVYKVPLYPIVPAIAIIGGGFVLINQLFMAGSGPRMIALAGIAITLVGLPVYMIMSKKKA
ncbi:MAG: APC family permease [Intestinibacter sp.]|uniref:APC family permease n=1 Tax=Intestinibacter sp. TaxID=1965304 RepID=UPI003F162B3B